MLDFDKYINENEYRVIKLFSRKEDGCVARLRRGDGTDIVCRLYDHEVQGYVLAQSLDCDELPKVYSCRSFEGGAIVLEEFVDGISLYELLESCRPDEGQTAAIGEKLCMALEALHGLGIIHRDIKPENVLITSTGRVVLIDLDAASKFDPEKHRDTCLLGTVGYAAPEQFGFSRSDVRTDIFSLGVMMNIMLTGEHPSRVLAEGDIRKVIEKCVEMNVDKRFSSASELRAELSRLSGIPSQCPECGFTTPGGGCLCCGIASEPRRRKKKRHIVLPFVLLGAVLLAGAIFAADKAGNEEAEDIPQTSSEASQVTVQPEDSPEPTVAATPEVEEMGDEPETDTGFGPDPFTLDYSPTPFEYDLDGDGTAETYYLGIMSEDNGSPRYSYIDGLYYDEQVQTEFKFSLALAVWEYKDDWYVPVKEFASLMEQQDICLNFYPTYIYPTFENHPLIEDSYPMFGIWECAKRLEFYKGCFGEWIAEGSAVIDGVSYTTQHLIDFTDFPRS